MISKDQVITLLEIHGMSISSSEDEIRTILLSAQYQNSEIEAAIESLRSDSGSNELSMVKKQGLHKIFFTDQNLKPNEVSALLGIDIEIDQVAVDDIKSNQKKSSHLNLIVIVLLISITVGVMTYRIHMRGTGSLIDSAPAVID